MGVLGEAMLKSRKAQPQKVLKVKDIQRLIRELSDSIRKESNKKEVNRLVDMQAALKCTLRIVDIYTTNGKCVR